MQSSAVLFTTLALVVSSMVPAQKDSAELAAVLDRAAQYVALYENQQLGNVTAAEIYRQVSVSFSPNKVRQEEERRLESDFLLFLQGNERVGLRVVRRVNGVPAPVGEASFEDLRDTSPEGIIKGVKALVEQSARYNIGGVRRTFNVPTFALRVVRKAESPMFNFVRRGTEKINGVETWEVTFKERTERTGPTLVRGEPASSGAAFLRGQAVDQPATGRILKTEFRVENPYSKPKAKGRVTVTYTENKTLRMVVPNQMIEFYESDDGFIDGRADYTNFWLFNVDVKSEVAPPPAK